MRKDEKITIIVYTLFTIFLTIVGIIEGFSLIPAIVCIIFALLMLHFWYSSYKRDKKKKNENN